MPNGRDTGTHYTPRSLTEPLIRYTLEPLVYEGPAEGLPRADWRLKSAKEILSLKVCDMAMGSGAFLVQACRFLSERVVEAWEAREVTSKLAGQLIITPDGDISSGLPSERPLPKGSDERLGVARRLVAERCLHGVDKNPMAVEMAKLSMWLVTLQKERPFTFLDHALRCGDSLVGLIDAEQVRHFHTDPARGKPLHKGLFEKTSLGDIRGALETATDLRRQLAVSTTNDYQAAIDTKRQLFDKAQTALSATFAAADIISLTALSMANSGPDALDGALVRAAAGVSRLFGRETPIVVSPDAACAQILRDLAIPHDTRPLHWLLEYPDAMESGGFDALVGNPPFRGGKLISGILGKDYREYLVNHLASGVKGHADLCAYFLLRAGSVLKRNGMMGMLATNSVAQGDTREVGLDQLFNHGFVVVRANPSTPWPGTANLEIAQIWLRKGPWRGEYMLEHEQCTGITAYLTEPGTVTGKPRKLSGKKKRAYQGTIVLGLGFVLTTEMAQALVAKDKKNSEVLREYINGKDFNSRPDQSGSRRVINFFDWPLSKEHAPPEYSGPTANDYPDCLSIIENTVKPERATKAADVRAAPWWQYWRQRNELYSAIENLKRVILITRVSKYLNVGFARADLVYTLDVFVVPSEDVAVLGLLQSSFHRCWAWQYGSSMRRDLRYVPSDVLDTFPFPDDLSDIRQAAHGFERHRAAMMKSRGIGLTNLQNAFHDPACNDDDVLRLRNLLVALDEAIRDAYGWKNLELQYGFRDESNGPRFTVTERSRRAMMGRLLALNHAQSKAE